MPSKKILITAVALSFVLSLILMAPAAVLYGWLQPKLGSVELVGVDGSLRDGSAAALQIGGRPVVEQLHWRLRLSDLLLARFGADLDSRGALLLDGHVSRSLMSVQAHDLRVSGSLRAVLAAIGQPFAPLDGELGLALDHLKLRGNWPVAAEGKVQVDKLAWTLARDPLLLGSYQAVLTEDGDDLVATISTLGGALEVNGDGRVKADRSYELHLQLRPRNGAPPMLQNLLNSLGAPDPQGFYHLRREGKQQAQEPAP